MTQLQRLVIAPNQLLGEHVHLTTEQQHYLSRVLRLQIGDRFIAMDGKGWWLAVLTNPAQAELLEPIAAHTELPITVTLLIALPKSGMDDIVRQTTELGVHQIVPILSQRTVLKPSPQKRDRWQRIAQEAAEQSERQLIPQISAPQSWTEALSQWNTQQSACYLCEARGDYPHLLTCLIGSREFSYGDASRTGVGSREGGVRLDASEASFQPIQPIQLPAVTIAIGPEGGWTEAEVKGAIAAGYQPVSLGARILRAVTAPVLALSLVGAVYEHTMKNDIAVK
jgi:16S rRNA (uracil1498-N3)-methyltransferase